MKKRMYLLPLLSAGFWYSCTDPLSKRNITPGEMDLRWGICGFCSSMIILFIVLAIAEAEANSK